MSEGIARKLRILVVDDEEVVRNCLALLLSLDGHRVELAPGAREGLAMFEPGKYDLVFTDYVMPGMGGTELVEEIHKRCPSQPVIMVTAQATELRRQNAVPKGVDCLVDKPFGLEDVRGAVRGVMPERSLAA